MTSLLHKKVDGEEVGLMLHYANTRVKKVIDQIVQKNSDNGVKGKYYIHFWFQPVKTEYAPYYHCRRTRPSPYATEDHYLWSVEDGGKVTFEWCIPKKEVTSYILSHPHEFDVEYVNMLRKYASDKLEKADDYVFQGQLI